GAVARGDVQAPAEGNGEVRKVAANAGLVVVRFQCRTRHARVLVTENDVSMDIVADRLHAAPSRGRLPKKIPGDFGETIGFAVPASEQEEQRFLWQVLHGNLPRARNDPVGCTGIV